jgi:NADH-quinone oxidoreductase subunit C/D
MMADNTPLPSEPAVVSELLTQFGSEVCTVQATLDQVPTLWVPRERLIEVLRFLRNLPKPYVMLYDLSAIDERLRKHRQGQPEADFTVFYHLLVDRAQQRRAHQGGLVRR